MRRASSALLTFLQGYLGQGEDAECGRSWPAATVSAPTSLGQVRIASIVHGSMVDGPGLRSVCFMQGCVRHCDLCHAPHRHSFDGGTAEPTSELVAELLRADVPRDGVTISGGDPLAQPEACAEIVGRLKDAGVHVVIYTGFTYEHLLRAGNPHIQRVLALSDVLVDGPFVAALRDESLAYRGSTNQRVIDLAGTRQAGRLCLLNWD
ncbi:MAG: radical SAM protein [Chloroflexi bacterium]|nr:radical SAM protein [Chloroflexota bacterium]